MTTTDAPISRFARVFGRIGRQVQRPYNRMLSRWHEKLAGFANRIVGDEAYFEYDRTKNEYVIAAPHIKQDPDQYQVGHSAGKLAGALALNPIVLLFIGMEVIEAVYPLLPQHWLVPLVYAVATVVMALGVVVALKQFITLSVAYQPTSGNRHEVAT